MSMNEFYEMAERVRNWGRWGSDDEIGTLNYITPEIVRDSARLVTKGSVFQLGMDFSPTGPQGDLLFRRNPMHVMTIDGGDRGAVSETFPSWETNGLAQEYGAFMGSDLLRFTDDMIIMHTQSATQWDALAHAYYDDKLYNGFSADTVTSVGAYRCGIDKVGVRGITSRAVLLDIVALRGADTAVPHGDPITAEELERAANSQNVEVREGDIVLVHTGWVTKFTRSGDRSPSAGLDWRAAEWFHDRRVAAVAADNSGVEDVASGITGNMLPMHLLCLREMGLSFGEFWDLTALAADCAEDGRYEFQVVAPPLRISGGVGSPINPVALK
ncbi:cyclase family protein [Rhodococcus erythropolis]|uniref:cyclase family protein n=1 Tax=Rhodococcus erythropolis TaxID=1833 RepID=UPI0037979C5E